MLLETLSTFNAVWDTTLPTVRAMCDAPGYEERVTYPSATFRQLFEAHRQEMVDRAAFHRRAQEAITALYDIAHRDA